MYKMWFYPDIFHLSVCHNDDKQVLQRYDMKNTLHAFCQKRFLATLLILSAGYVTSAQLPTLKQCSPSYIPTFYSGCGTSNNGYIKSLSTTNGINNITNNNTNCGNTSTSYSDYTGSSMKVTQEANKSVNVKVSWVGNSGSVVVSSVVRIYVDWNRNGLFTDADEFIVIPGALGMNDMSYYGVNNNSSMTYPITVPGHAKDGLTRMRIVTGANALIPDFRADPCGSANYGEVEDYTFEVINPCVPPNVLSIANVDYKSGHFSWTKKDNAEFYEYVITPADTIPDDTVVGFTFTSKESVDVDTFECNQKYYVLVRAICDTTGKPGAKYWDKSVWMRDSFTTPQCCHIPKVTVDKITSTTARVKWDAIATAVGYEYAVTTVPTPPQKGTYTINNSVFLQGLSSKQTYFVYVRSRCSPTPLSDWTKMPFKTPKSLSVDNIGNKQDMQMLAYPSPVHDILTVELKGEVAAHAHLIITDISGKVMYNTFVVSQLTKVDMSSFSSGIYIVKYADDKHNDIMKVSK